MTARFWEISRFAALGVPIISCHSLMARCCQRLLLEDFLFSFLHFTLQDENQEEDRTETASSLNHLHLSFSLTRKKEFCKCYNWNCEQGNFQNVCHFFALNKFWLKCLTQTLLSTLYLFCLCKGHCFGWSKQHKKYCFTAPNFSLSSSKSQIGMFFMSFVLPAFLRWVLIPSSFPKTSG